MNVMISQVFSLCYNDAGKIEIRDLRMLKDLKNIDTSRDYITTPEAAKRSGLSKVYLANLLRQGKLEGFRLSREWFIYTDSLEKFLATPRKSGPKGPMKKKTVQDNANSRSPKENQNT
jgi:excisionase family DNA binding protein